MEKTILEHKSTILNIVSGIFGVLFFVIGVINLFWGNDAGFGIFIIMLSLVYFFPVNRIAERLISISIPRIGLVKVAIGIFIVFAALGVGELFDKIDMMMLDLQN